MNNEQDPWCEFEQHVVEALQAAYPHLSADQLTVLLIATGVSRELAFPWHSDKAASSVHQSAAH